MKKRITDGYFKPKSFEKWRNGRIYEYLGVKYAKKGVFAFGKLMDKITGQDKINKERGIESIYKRQIKDLRDIGRLEKTENLTRITEAIHLFLAISSATFGAIYLSYGRNGSASLNGALVAFNLYLLSLQRYNRQRINNLIDKKNKSHSSTQLKDL